MGQLQEERKAKVSLMLLAAFIHLWSSDTLSTHVGEHEVMWHGSRLYTAYLLVLYPSSKLGVWYLPLWLGHTDKFGLSVPSGPCWTPRISLYWPTHSYLFPLPEVAGPTGSLRALSLLIHIGIMGHFSGNTVLVGHFCWAIPVQLKCSDYSDFWVSTSSYLTYWLMVFLSTDWAMCKTGRVW